MVSIKNLFTQGNFVKFDKIADYVPLLSTATNLVNLFQKCVVMRFMKPETIQKSHYYTHLQKKDLGICVALLVPVLGNIVVPLYHLIIKKMKSHIIERCEKGVVDIKKIPKAFKADSKFMLELIKIKPEIVKELPSELKGNAECMLVAIKIDFKAIDEASEALRGDFKFMLEAAKINSNVIEKAMPALKADSKFMLAAIKIDYKVIKKLSVELRSDATFMLELIKLNSQAIEEASDTLKDNPEFMLAAIKIDYKVIRKASAHLKANSKFMLDAAEINRKAAEEASVKLKEELKFAEDLIRATIHTNQAPKEWKEIQYYVKRFEEKIFPVVERKMNEKGMVPIVQHHLKQFKEDVKALIQKKAATWTSLLDLAQLLENMKRDFFKTNNYLGVDSVYLKVCDELKKAAILDS